jgi:hypothetical protein
MPLIYRILGYGGNGLLAVFGLLALLSGKAFWIGGFLAALGGINLYLIRKIDLYSREEAWLEAGRSSRWTGRTRPTELRASPNVYPRRTKASRRAAEASPEGDRLHGPPHRPARRRRCVSPGPR